MTALPWWHQSTSQTKRDCEHCGRRVGGVHQEDCPRSRKRTRALQAWARAIRRRLVPFWLFGPQVVQIPGKGQQITYNPGIPHVDQSRGKPWKAGGVPHGHKKKVEEFKRALAKTLGRRGEAE